MDLAVLTRSIDTRLTIVLPLLFAVALAILDFNGETIKGE